MGVYDSIDWKCPKCGKRWEAQSKSGPCTLESFTQDAVPMDVAFDANRHAPFECECGSVWKFDMTNINTPAIVSLNIIPASKSIPMTDLDKIAEKIRQIFEIGETSEDYANEIASWVWSCLPEGGEVGHAGKGHPDGYDTESLTDGFNFCLELTKLNLTGEGSSVKKAKED